MTRSSFAVSSAVPVLARIPALPAAGPVSGPVPPAGADALLREGMFLASRHVSRELDRPAEHPDDRGGLAATRRGYQIRAGQRPVPHGVFAAVAPARFADPGEVPVLGLAGYRVRTNPSAAWLTALRDQLLADPTVLAALTLSANNLVAHRGRRLVHERPGGNGDPPHRVSVRATAATELIVGMAARGASLHQIRAAVTVRWPVPEHLVRATVAGLVRDGLLQDDLLPVDLTTDPLGHLLDRIAEGHGVREPLVMLRTALAVADQHQPGDPDRLRVLREARDLADRICPVDRPLTADLAADARLVLPTSLAVEAAAAAGVLSRTGSDHGPLVGCHERFLERYGVHRFVPLLEATDPVIGLSLDAVDADPSELSHPSSDHRTAVLAGLLTRAAATGGVEVRLDDADVAALAHGQPDLPPPRTAEITVRVLAATAQDLATGRLHLAVCPGGLPDAGTALGRYTSLLRIGNTDRGERAGERSEPVLVAEIVASPRMAEGRTIAPPTGLAAWRIPIGVTTQPGDLVPEELLLGSDGVRLILWSARHDRQVVPVLYSRLAPRLLPPLARFLGLLGRAGHGTVRGWSWAPADGLPFTPRVRYRRTVLAPARWVLPAALVDAAADATAWPAALRRWRVETTPAPPGVVVIDDGDRLLPLDLDRDDDRELLRRHVRRNVRAVTEPLGGPDAVHAVLPGPTGGHLLELVIPLARRNPRPRPGRRAPGPVRDAGVGIHFPGGQWLSLAIRTPDGELLLPELAGLARHLAEHYEHWFWLRYHTTDLGPHLRARFRGDPSTLGGRVLPAFAEWGQEMIRQRLSGGFTVETYEQEIERYGGPAAIGAAERVFATDSELALATLAATADPDQRLVIAAVSAAAIAGCLTNDTTSNDRADDALVALAGRRLDRDARRRLLDLRPTVRAARDRLATGPDVDGIGPAWIARHDALTAYRSALDPALAPGCASSVIHMHVNRLLGDRRHESTVRALAADLLATLHRAP